MSLIHSSSQTAYPISEWLGVYPCMRLDFFVCVCCALGKQTRIEKQLEHRENKDKRWWGLGIEPCTNYRNTGILKEVFSAYLQPQWPPPPDYQTLFRTFLLNTWAKFFLFLLTDVSLSLTLSETRWKVAAVSEVPPRSVLINHPQSLYSPLPPSPSPASPASSLSLLIQAHCLPPPHHSLSLFCHSLSLPLLSPLCLSVFISPSCQSLPSLSYHLQLPRFNT